MMKKLLIIALSTLMIGCGQQEKSPVAAVRSSPTLIATPTTPPKLADDELPVTNPLAWTAPASSDTVLLLNGHPYHLNVRMAMDSTQRLTAPQKDEQGEVSDMPGYDGNFTFTLTDSAYKQVFRRRLRKADFYERVGKVVVVPSEMSLPQLIGYSAPMKALVFTTGFAVPGTDWGSDVVILLDLAGEVKMSEGRSYGGGACTEPVLSGDCQVLLTTYEVLRSQRPPLKLERPDADLVGACLLSDTTLLVVYTAGKSHDFISSDGTHSYGRTPSPQQERAPNAFVRNTVTGRIIQRFRYNGFYEALGFSLPWHYLSATANTYLLDEKRGLYGLPRAAPSVVTETKFSSMPVFAAPQTANEVRFELAGESQRFAFYVDTASQARNIRYQRLKD